MRLLGFATFVLAGALSLPLAGQNSLGSVVAVKSITCPPRTSIPGGVCQQLTVSSANTASFVVNIKTNYPSGIPILGIIPLTSGGSGGQYYESFKHGPDVINDLLAAGFVTVQVSFQYGKSGWITGPGGILALSNRYATSADWIYNNLRPAGTPMCATGNSGGGTLIAYALSQYGIASEFTFAELTSSPVYSRIDNGCLDNLTALNICSAITKLRYPLSTAEEYVDPAYPNTSACSLRNNDYRQTFLNDSLVNGYGLMNFPITVVNVLIGALDNGPAPAQSVLWTSQVTSTITTHCVPGVNHYIPDYKEGASQISSDLIAGCHY